MHRSGASGSCPSPGGKLKVPTLDGAATIKLPEGTQNGMIFRLRGKGVKALRSSEVGDMLVEVEVEIPTQLSKDQTDKLNAFASTLDEKRNQPACVAFADKAAVTSRTNKGRNNFPRTWRASFSPHRNGPLLSGSSAGMKRTMPPRCSA